MQRLPPVVAEQDKANADVVGAAVGDSVGASDLPAAVHPKFSTQSRHVDSPCCRCCVWEASQANSSAGQVQAECKPNQAESSQAKPSQPKWKWKWKWKWKRKCKLS